MPDNSDGITPQNPISPREASYFDYLADEGEPLQLSFIQTLRGTLTLGTGSVLHQEDENGLEK